VPTARQDLERERKALKQRLDASERAHRDVQEKLRRTNQDLETAQVGGWQGVDGVLTRKGG
jgi:hypothetical protein